MTSTYYEVTNYVILSSQLFIPSLSVQIFFFVFCALKNTEDKITKSYNFDVVCKGVKCGL